MKKSLECYRQIDDPFYVAILLNFVSVIYRRIGRPVDLCLDYSRQSADLMRETGNLSWIMWPLESLGRYALKLGDVALGEKYYREAYEICRQFNNRLGVAWMGHYLSLFFFWGDSLASARRLAQESLEIASDLNHPGSMSFALLSLAYIELVEEHYVESQQLYEKSLPLAEYRLPMSNTYQGLCAIACALGDFEAARTHLKAALEYFDKPEQFVVYLTPKLVLGAIIMAHENETERAVEILGCAHAYTNDTVHWLQRWDFLTRLYADLEARLGSEVYTAAWERGKHLDLDTVWADLQIEIKNWN